MFDDTETEKCEFNQHKTVILLSSIDINKIVVSNKVSFIKKDRKYFCGHNDAKKIKSLCIFLPKMSAYRKYFDETKCISFFD